MAIIPTAVCDLCSSMSDVHALTVSWAGDRANPFEADVCGDCFEKNFGVLRRKGRRPARSNVRPQHRFEKAPDEAFTV